MMKRTMIAAFATFAFAGVAFADDFPATPMNAGPPMMNSMMAPMMAPMAAPASEPMMDKPMTKRQKRMMMKKKMMMDKQPMQ